VPREISLELEARETEWKFAPDRSLRGFAFNGGVPGPLIEADAGDTIRVRLTNSLPQPTTIHWHGLRVPADMDGTEAVQPPVQPGDAFDYVFVVPDAATFWYHSHVNETEQLERGLYGAFVVRGPEEPTLDGERVLLLDDLKLDPSGELAPFGDEHELHEGAKGTCCS
jgi:FtsP/CotA-like multicopper oxidase with cupredoxin domain